MGSLLSCKTVALLSAETPDFIGPQYWLPNKLDLNSTGYAIWGILQERHYRCQISSFDHLKDGLIHEWRHFVDQRIHLQSSRPVVTASA